MYLEYTGLDRPIPCRPNDFTNDRHPQAPIVMYFHIMVYVFSRGLCILKINK
jgi:hypothetical protein